MSLAHLAPNDEFSALELLAKQTVEGFLTGLHKSPFHGFSAEFAEHRLYNTGESTRHIDWKQYAKTEKLFVKRYEEETNLRAYLLIDQSRSMLFEQKLQFSVEASACLIQLLHRQRDAAAIGFFSDRMETLSEAKSTPSHIKYLFRLLENSLATIPQINETKTVQHSRIADSLHELAEQLHRRSLILIFSDMFDDLNEIEPLFAAFQHLKYKGHEVIVFHTLAEQKEAQFDFEARPHRFFDLETNEQIQINPADLQQPYQEKMDHFRKTLHHRCLQNGIDYMEANTDLGYYPVLRAYLMRRQKMQH